MKYSGSISDRIKALRAEMRREKIDLYIIPSTDYHNSEYIGEYFKERQYMTGFTGSAGTVVFTEEKAGLWTDGRYFIQAEQELQGSEIILFKAGEPGCPFTSSCPPRISTERNPTHCVTVSVTRRPSDTAISSV